MDYNVGVKQARITAAFREDRKNFSYLSISVIAIIQERLGVTFSRQTGSVLRWILERKNRRIVLQIFYDGKTFIYRQSRLRWNERIHAKEEYFDLESDFSFRVVLLTEDGGVDEIIQEIKKHLFYA